jgi:aryl-alcohol dehydrogenase-like predicted oxidoreductase
VKLILERATAGGIRTLDTAAAYGDAETILGNLAEITKPFRFVTKTIGLKNGLDAVVARARKSTLLLGRCPIDLLLVHSADDLLMPDGPALWDALLGLRDEGLFGDIGISTYVADDPVRLARRFRPKAIQLPFSIMDQRLQQSGALDALKGLGVEIHARSLFLQGLLFLATEELPPKLAHIGARMDRIRQELSEAGLTPLQGALAFVLGQEQIDVGLVGVIRPQQLEQILEAASGPHVPSIDWMRFALDDPMVLTPSLW